MIFVDEIQFFCWKDKRPEIQDEIAGPAIDDISEVWHYQSSSIDWAEDIPGSNIVFSILAEKLLMMKKNSQSWLEAMLLLSSPHFHGKKAIAGCRIFKLKVGSTACYRGTTDGSEQGIRISRRAGPFYKHYK